MVGQTRNRWSLCIHYTMSIGNSNIRTLVEKVLSQGRPPLVATKIEENCRANRLRKSNLSPEKRDQRPPGNSPPQGSCRSHARSSQGGKSGLRLYGKCLPISTWQLKLLNLNYLRNRWPNPKMTIYATQPKIQRSSTCSQ